MFAFFKADFISFCTIFLPSTPWAPSLIKSYLLIDADDSYKLTDETRKLGLTVCRGTAVVLICPLDGMESISNPFLQQEA